MTIDSSRHHEVLYDARLASAVLDHAINQRGVDGLDALLGAITLLFGEIAPGEWYGTHLRGTAALPAANLNADPESPFYGKVVAFTGELCMVGRAAWELVARAGGQPAPEVTKQTNMLVCGYQDMYRRATGETKSAKLRHAEDLHANSEPIEILTERDFFRMLTEAQPAVSVMSKACCEHGRLASVESASRRRCLIGCSHLVEKRPCGSAICATAVTTHTRSLPQVSSGRDHRSCHLLSSHGQLSFGRVRPGGGPAGRPATAGLGLRAACRP